MPTSAAIYCRISKDRVGAGLGIERQEADCRELANRLGWTVTTVHTDNDISAYSGKPRPGYGALLADLETGRVNAVLAWHTDRLHRSPVELEHYIAVCDTRAVPTHCVKAGPLDLATPSGRLVARQLGAVARYEVEHMIERQKAAKLQAAQAGKFRGGRRAFGFEPDGVTVRPSEAAHVLDATHRVLHGESLGSIARGWNSQGIASSMGAQWTSMSVHDLLVRARNAGLVEHDGEPITKACWPAIVPEDTWRAVRVLLADPARRNPRSTDRRWLGSGLYLCGVCNDGTTMRSASVVGSNRHRHRATYRCKAGPHLARIAQTVDEYVTAVVLARLSQPDAAGLLRENTSVDTQGLSSEATALRVRLDELAGLFAEGAVTGAQLTEGTARIRQRLNEVEIQLAGAVAGSPLEGLAGAEDVTTAWEAISISRRKAVIAVLMTVTLLPAPRGRRPGGHYFDPDYVRIVWRQG
jgi:DNA invertase Pin-like site-specific DNA recombinase